jgi:hypothetical protein
MSIEMTTNLKFQNKGYRNEKMLRTPPHLATDGSFTKEQL